MRELLCESIRARASRLGLRASALATTIRHSTLIPYRRRHVARPCDDWLRRSRVVDPSQTQIIMITASRCRNSRSAICPRRNHVDRQCHGYSSINRAARDCENGESLGRKWGRVAAVIGMVCVARECRTASAPCNPSSQPVTMTGPRTRNARRHSASAFRIKVIEIRQDKPAIGHGLQLSVATSLVVW